MRKASAPLFILATAFAAPVAHAQSYATTILNDAPLQYYRLSETSGGTALNAVGGNNGTINGTVSQGQPGALVGDANTSYAFSLASPGNVAIPRLISGDFSLEFWFNTTADLNPGASQWYQGAGLVDMEVGGVTNDFGTSLSGGRVLFGVGSPDITIFSTSMNLNNGQWHHVVATRTQATGLMQLYINGVLENTSTGIGTNTSTLTASSILRIGTLQTQSGQYAGRIDEVAIYNRVLSQSQVTAHRTAGLSSAAAPEPGSAVLALGGLAPLAGMVVARRRRSR